MKKDLLFELLRRSETVWSVGEISQILREIPPKKLYGQLAYYAKVGKLRRLSSGLYAKLEYRPQELANKLYVPSYISLETVLARAGVIFQYYETTYLVSYLNREVRIDGHVFQYRRIKNEVLTDTAGVVWRENFFAAEPERAWLDAVYCYRDYHFDNLDRLDWEKIQALQHLYKNKALIKRVARYRKIYEEEK